MQLKLVGAALIAAAVAIPKVAAADGELTARGVYYKEKSTRVMQPMLDGMFEAGAHGIVTGHFLVDSITSASAGSGAANATPFTETRYEAAGGYTHAFSRLRLGLDGKFSTESDYRSFYVGARGELDLAQKNATIGFGGGASFDRVSAASAQGPSVPTIACDPADIMVQATKCSLDVYSGFVSGSQILSRDTIAAVTFELSDLEGYQSNPYRLVVAADGLTPERHPDSRTREAVAASLRYYVESSQTTLIAAYRYYHDNWDITAHTPELRVVQELGHAADASFRYRYYTQSAAFFFSEKYTTSNPAMQQFLTADPKMSSFDGHTLEAKLGIYGRAFDLGGTWAGARFEGILEYVIQHNAFGNAVVAHLALSLPFDY